MIRPRKFGTKPVPVLRFPSGRSALRSWVCLLRDWAAGLDVSVLAGAGCRQLACPKLWVGSNRKPVALLAAGQLARRGGGAAAALCCRRCARCWAAGLPAGLFSIHVLVRQRNYGLQA